jgi:cation diffusion facilitator family transporter
VSAEDNLPQDRRGDFAKARRLAWLTIAYLVSTILLLGVVLGSSQALKTAWADDVLSLFPPILFLVGSHVAGRKPTESYPFGFGRAVSAAYLGASVALFAVGGYLLVDALSKLVAAEHPTIGGVEVFGHVIWHGWVAIPVLVWSGLPAVFLGRAKLPLAERLHDKVLYADASMNAADWQTASAALIGVIGVAFGFWWADAAAGALISLEILRDGLSNVRAALADLMDRRPQQLLKAEPDPLPRELTEFLESQDWVADAAVRVREQGRQFLAEAMVVPKREDGLVENIEQVSQAACDLDWRLLHVNITPVSRIPDEVRGHTPQP